MRSEAEHDLEALRTAPAVLVSVIVHLVLLIALALFLVNSDDDSSLVLEMDAVDHDPVSELASFDIQPVEPESTPPSEQLVAISEFSHVEPLVLSSLPRLDLRGSLQGISDGLSSKIRDARKNGIEIVVVFDSTGSMGSEIEAVKRRIGEIGDVVLQKIPQARFSLVTYRDRRDEYLVRGVALSNDLTKLQSFIGSVRARGGGDIPEALEAGMEWALDNNALRSDSQKVMLIFGDAPPHRQHFGACLKMAREFQGRGKGRVSTVTCQSKTPLREFYEIAKAGGGDAYTLRNSHHLMEELLVLAFGHEHRDDVLKFFDLQ